MEEIFQISQMCTQLYLDPTIELNPKKKKEKGKKYVFL